VTSRFYRRESLRMAVEMSLWSAATLKGRVCEVVAESDNEKRVCLVKSVVRVRSGRRDVAEVEAASENLE